MAVNERYLEEIIARAFAPAARDTSRQGIERKEWVGLIEGLKVPEIARVIAGLAGGKWMSPGSPQYQAAARAIVDQKIADRLDASASWLGRVGIGLGVVQVVLAVVQVWLAMG
jgi:hypothetical protein